MDYLEWFLTFTCKGRSPVTLFERWSQPISREKMTLPNLKRNLCLIINETWWAQTTRMTLPNLMENLGSTKRRVNLGSDHSPMAATTVPPKECWKIATACKYELLAERTTKRGHFWAAFVLKWDLTPVSVWWSSGLGRGSRWPRHNQQDQRRTPWVMPKKQRHDFLSLLVLERHLTYPKYGKLCDHKEKCDPGHYIPKPECSLWMTNVSEFAPESIHEKSKNKARQEVGNAAATWDFFKANFRALREFLSHFCHF